MTTKVYIIVLSVFYDYGIRGVYSTEELAEKELTNHKDDLQYKDATIEEWIVDGEML